MAEDEEFCEEEYSENKENTSDQDVDNDEITPGEEGFIQGYEETEEEEKKKEEQKEEEE